VDVNVSLTCASGLKVVLPTTPLLSRSIYP